MAMDYDEYKRDYVHDWAQRISARAGREPGKGGRGKKDSPLRRLCESLSVEYGTWERYRAGAQIPNASNFKVIHYNAINKMGLIGQGRGLRAIIERGGLMSHEEWLFWQRYESNPRFELDDEEQAMLEKADELERQAAILQNEAAALRRALGF